MAIRLPMMTGRLPIRSESRPQSGEKRNCMSEYEVLRSPTATPVAPYVSA